MTNWIALDIDGTITDQEESIPYEVVDYLKSLIMQGWKIAFLTGRSYSFARKILSCIQFPYFFAPQNGALLLEVPSQTILIKKYLSKEILLDLEARSEGLDCAMVVYGDVEEEHTRFCKGIEQWRSFFEEGEGEEQKVEHFAHLVRESFPLIKFIGCRNTLERLHLQMTKIKVQSSLIRHPRNNLYGFLLITHRGVNKGMALRKLVQREKRGKIIAAGNDDNDWSMLQEADLKIVMEDAPEHLVKKADLIASPASKNGIIFALQRAIERLRHE